MESEILKYEVQKCPYCKKSSYFKKEIKQKGVVEVKVCGHCGDCMNGFD
jgi:transcription elongation factor Elf1